MENTLKKTPVIGFVRYSQKVKFDKGKERNVFEPDYFEYRYNIFKNITLRCFQEQTNMNFVLLLLHSENMPHEYKDRFIELEKANSFLHNIFLIDTIESFKESLEKSIEYASFEQDTAVTFRIDNDDAVPNDFIQRLNCFINNNFAGYSICMPNICIVKRISDASYMVEERYSPSNSIGLSYVTNKNIYKTIFDLGDHGAINEQTPMILITGYGGLRTINGENVANAIKYEKTKVYKNRDMEKYLDERNLNNIELKYIRILSSFSLKMILKLLIPPFFILITKKLLGRK